MISFEYLLFSGIPAVVLLVVMMIVIEVGKERDE